MDRKDFLRNLLIAGGVFLIAWSIGDKFLFPPRPTPPPPISESSAQPVTPAEPVATTGQSPNSGTPQAPQANPISAQPSSPNGQKFTVLEATEEKIWALGSDPSDPLAGKASESPYRMHLRVSNVGASVESILVTDHAERLRDEARYALLSAQEVHPGGMQRSLAIEKINIDDVDVPLHDKRWQWAEPGVADYSAEGNESGRQIEMWIDLQEGSSPAFRLTRTYRLPRQSADSGRHDLYATVKVQNLSNAPHRVVVSFRGGIGIRIANPQRDDRVVDVGIRSAEGLVAGRRRTFQEVARQLQAVLQPTEPGSKVSWAATANTYFTCTMAPIEGTSREPAGWLAQAMAVDLDGSPATIEDITVRFVTRADSLSAGQSAVYPVEIFAGVNDGEVFNRLEPYKSRNYYFQIAQGYGWCTFTFLVELMIWLLNRTYSILPNYGVAIIVLVCIVRFLLHPITKKGQVNMVRMQTQMGELSPKLEDIKKRFANDKTRLQQEIMKVYRESGINPANQFLTCLPMFIQMPIWVALYLSLSYNIRMRHEPFVFWIQDLTAQDALWTFATPLVVPILGWVIPSFNLLPILVAASMYLQQKTQPKPKPNPNLSDEQRMQQEMMQRMMPWMSVMFLILFYKMPSGLTLYITASNFLGMLEQWHIRKHIKGREADGTLLKPVRKPPPPNKDSGGSVALPGWLERIQKRIEDAQKISRTQRAKPRR